MTLVYHGEELGKICSKCKTWRPIFRFGERLASRDGYDYMCFECKNENSRKWRANNKEKVQQLNRLHHSKNREQRNEYHRQYRQRHPDYFRHKMQEFRQNNPDYHRKLMRRWSRANASKIKAKDNRRRAFKMGKVNSFTAQEWDDLKERYDYTCLRCGRTEPDIKLTADHIIPISKNGRGTIDNIQPLCGQCNTAKHDNSYDYRPDKL